MGTLIIVGWKETPQVRSPPPVGQGSISDRLTPNAGIGISNMKKKHNGNNGLIVGVLFLSGIACI